MPQSLERIKTFPLPDGHLHGAAIMACSILDNQEATIDCRAQLESLQMAVATLWRAVHNLEDLFDRMDCALQMAVAAKERPVFKVPDWFFQAENEDTGKMLIRRARYLKAARVPIDDAWDRLHEFATDILYLANPDEPVSKAIKAVFGAREGGS